MTAPLDIQRATHDGLIILRLRGDIDLSNVAMLEGALQQVCTGSADASRVVVDATAVEFLSVAGIAALVQAQTRCRQNGLDFAVVAAQRAVLRPLQAIGLDRQVKIFTSGEAAIATSSVGSGSTGNCW
ncbi:anti-sigma factor antagonist [Mycobacterium sp.]|uniref:anti-sigma factor antagonist n=1 Tax=Mycobacterium sp. TaxID=1785 RepID=UPI003D6B7608